MNINCENNYEEKLRIIILLSEILTKHLINKVRTKKVYDLRLLQKNTNYSFMNAELK